MSAVLEFRDVSLAAAPPYETGVTGVSFVLSPGDLALIRLSYAARVTPLADLACGVVDPDAGEVLFGGVAWAATGADRQAEQRGRVGRVFERAGWLSNLDVDENVTLARRYHERMDPAAALAAAQELALRLGLPALPAGRPAGAPRGDLLRAQWVRALMGEPLLLLLERPGRDLASGAVDPLVAELNRRRAKGAAVLWLTDEHERIEEADMRPTLKFDLQDGNIRPLT